MEVLFRGQTRRLGEKIRMNGEKVPSNWAYGGICKGPGGFSIIYGDMNEEKENPIEKFVVYTDTVGMFTGKILNGEKLFQDDIVEWYEDVDDSWGYTKEVHGYSLVVLDEENFCWSFMSDDGKKTPFNDWTWENCQIAGNIHDRPDLFEVKA